jgi:hypothetical protein
MPMQSQCIPNTKTQADFRGKLFQQGAIRIASLKGSTGMLFG